MRSLVRRIRVAGRVSSNEGVATLDISGRQALSLDRPPASIPNVTIVVLIKSNRLVCVHGKNKTRTVMLIRLPD
ncbi:MAG: hypothetical protein ISR62_01630 [Desulfobacteraceae bacterium]|nr:hypothetical protein [Desulfobacteraceae bacterium]